MIGSRLLFGIFKATVAIVVLMAAGAGVTSAASDGACSGGSIAPGVYASLKIAGTCTVDKGSVTVEHNLTVLPGASLIAVTGAPLSMGASNLTVGGNLDVQAGGVLNLGCEPVKYTCSNDPDQVVGTFSTEDTVAGNLTAENALGVVVHHTAIGGNVSLSGGGGGVNSCGVSVPALGFAPPYGDFEDDVIGGNLAVTGWQSCWLGLFRDTVMHNVDFNGNVTGDPDGNEMGNNVVVGNLSCSGNSPAAQFGDSGAGPSTVLGNANGQCAGKGLVVP
jgi:hypothetical protein